MQELRPSSSGYVALRHLMIAGFAFPVFINLLLGFILNKLLPESIMVPILRPLLFNGFLQYVPFILTAIWVIIGVRYSAKYLRKTFVINSPMRISIIATMYLVVAGVLFLKFDGWFFYLNWHFIDFGFFRLPYGIISGLYELDFF